VERNRILIVDDEEAILETMAFTFEDDYEVLTSTSAPAALELLNAKAPVAVVLSDQRMPEMTGVEFLSKVFEHHPTTVRIILTGFADMDATIGAINDGHVYAYITKPWEQDDLKQVVRRAVEHHQLAVENERLLAELRGANVFLRAVVDQIATGAIAIDAQGTIRAANRPAHTYLGLDANPSGRTLFDVLGEERLAGVAQAVKLIESEEDRRSEDLELAVGSESMRLRVQLEKLVAEDGSDLGRVLLVKEISHEPLRRRFEEVVAEVCDEDGPLRDPLVGAQKDLRTIADAASKAHVASPGMAELGDRVSRTATAIEYWLAVDDLLSREDFPDAQILMDRMRVANARWPLPGQLPQRVSELARRVEAYYESGENPRQPVL
jgi:FixJ family two-component response regulator